MRHKLDVLYKDIRSVPAFSAKIAEFLRQNDLHSKNRRITKKIFPRRRVIARFPFDVWMADTINFDRFNYQNDRYAFIIVMIDCFTRKVWAVPVKFIDAAHSSDTFETVFKTLERYPTHLVTDKGTEFFNDQVKLVLENYGVNHYAIPTKTKSKASLAERVIRTIESRLGRYMQLHNKNRWIDILDEIIANYNETPHKTTGYKPNDINETNQLKIYRKLYNNIPTEPRLHLGDKVRIKIEKRMFEKGYTQNWSDEIYVVTKVRDSQGVVWYRVSTFDNEQKPGIYYYYQLNLVSSKKRTKE